MHLLQGASQTIAALSLLGSLAAATSTSTSTSSAISSAQTGATYANGFDISKSWSNLSPYKDADFGLPKGVPAGCELSQVHALHRHAERFPGSGLLEADGMENFHSKVVNYSKAHPNKAVGQGPLNFLNDWTYLLGQDLLLDSGAATETTAGADFWSRYGRLLYHSKPGAAAWDPSLNTYSNGTSRPRPVFRTTSQSRILESARWWLSKFIIVSCCLFSYILTRLKVASLETLVPIAPIRNMISLSFLRRKGLTTHWPLPRPVRVIMMWGKL